jgi:S-DNA-T family DNA segregation ATPase FtsK/SpoIIIE
VAQSTSQNRNDSLKRVLDFGQAFIEELWRGIKTNTIPWHFCCGWGVVFATSFALRWDALVWKLAHTGKLYPFWPPLYWAYAFVWITMGFWLWVLQRTIARYNLVNRLTRAFTNAGLVTKTGRKPGFIADEQMDKHLRKLVVTSAGLPKTEFEKAKAFLSSELQVHIDEIRAHIERGTVDILYAYSAMPDTVPFNPEECKTPLNFKVGETRVGPLYVSLRDVPHILAGGYTSSGKSTFLRQALTTLTLNNPGVEFTLIDLKGGLELMVFKELPGVQLYSRPLEAIEALKYVESLLEKRMALLGANRANDLNAYFKVPESKRIYPKEWPKERKLNRHIVVVDEAAELYMASATLAAKDAQVAKRLTSKIAALGRAVGIHLIIATQRPDKNAVDPLIKTNLQGRLCFQMADNASSMTILDSVRAADLPPTKGRAIWRNGLDLIEVQVPWLSREDMEPMLASKRVVDTGSPSIPNEAISSTTKKETVVLQDEIDVHDQVETFKQISTEESLS